MMQENEFVKCSIEELAARVDKFETQLERVEKLLMEIRRLVSFPKSKEVYIYKTVK